MNQLDFPVLSLITFLPLAGALVILLISRDKANAIKTCAFAVTAVDFVISLALYFTFQSDNAQMQFVEHAPWIESLGISYYLGVDGISLFLVLLTTLLTPIAVLSSWTAITEKVKEYMVFMLSLIHI